MQHHDGRQRAGPQVAGQVLRGLRLWHSSPSPCAACRQPLGALAAQPLLRRAITPFISVSEAWRSGSQS